MLSKEQILKTDDLPRRVVKTPEWGGEVLVRGLASGERDAYMDSHVKIEAGSQGSSTKVTIANSEALLATKCIIDADGKRLFTDGEAEMLAKKSGSVIHRIVGVIEQISGLLDAEQTEKNSETPQGDDSASG